MLITQTKSGHPKREWLHCILGTGKSCGNLKHHQQDGKEGTEGGGGKRRVLVTELPVDGAQPTRAPLWLCHHLDGTRKLKMNQIMVTLPSMNKKKARIQDETSTHQQENSNML